MCRVRELSRPIARGRAPFQPERRGVGPANHGRRRIDVNRGRYRGAGVIDGVGRRKLCKQGLGTSHAEYRTGSRSVNERAGHGSFRIQLRRSECRSIADCSRIGPVDRGRRRLNHVDRDRCRCTGVIEGIGRRERDRQRVAIAGRKDRAGGGGVHECAGDGRCRVQLGGGECGSGNDRGGIGPGNRGLGRLDDIDRRCRGSACVIECIQRRKGDIEGLAVARVKDRAGTWGIGESAGDRRRAIN